MRWWSTRRVFNGMQDIFGIKLVSGTTLLTPSDQLYHSKTRGLDTCNFRVIFSSANRWCHLNWAVWYYEYVVVVAFAEGVMFPWTWVPAWRMAAGSSSIPSASWQLCWAWTSGSRTLISRASAAAVVAAAESHCSRMMRVVQSCPSCCWHQGAVSLCCWWNRMRERRSFGDGSWNLALTVAAAAAAAGGTIAWIGCGWVGWRWRTSRSSCCWGSAPSATRSGLWGHRC